MRCRKRRINRRFKSGIFLLIAFLVILIMVFIKIDKAIKPVAIQQADHYSKLTANKIISSAVSDYLRENQYTYSDFAAVLYDEEGRAVSVEAISYNINKVQSELTMIINAQFMRAGEASAEIPLGSITKSFLLAGKGPHIRLRICPVREASVKLTSSFSSAGVNQTCHRISAVVTAEINSSIPLYSFSSEASFEFLLAENIIVGEVPESSLNLWKV